MLKMRQTIYCAVLQLIYYKTLIIKYNKKKCNEHRAKLFFMFTQQPRALDNILL